MKRRGRDNHTLIAIVPVNILSKSKARLAPSFGAAERRRLSTAMLLDVLRAIKSVRRVHRITVVSADRSVGRIARAAGGHFLWEGKRRGLNKGLRLALRDAAARRATAALILPSDLPVIRPHEIRAFLKRSAGYPMAMNPSKDGAGTNALLLRPPEIIGPSFGRNSFPRHLAIARRKGLSVKVVRMPGISLDVDETRDLARVKRRSIRNETGRLLKAIEAEGTKV